MRFLITLALLASVAAHAAAEGSIDYDPALSYEQQRIVHLYVRTRECLGTAARAILAQDVREPSVVEHFMARMCADPFYDELRRTGTSEKQARLTLVEMTKQALYEDVLHKPIPKN